MHINLDLKSRDLSILTKTSYPTLVVYLAGTARLAITGLVGLKSDLIMEAVDFPSFVYLNEILTTPRKHADIDDISLTAILAMEPDKIHEYIAFDEYALPDRAIDIPVDEILESLQGALHGLHTLIGLTIDDHVKGQFSPGQVLDIFHLFELIELGGVPTLPKYVIQDIEELHKILSTAADDKQPLNFYFT